jgi:hypothetical protein
MEHSHAVVPQELVLPLQLGRTPSRRAAHSACGNGTVVRTSSSISPFALIAKPEPENHQGQTAVIIAPLPMTQR